MKKFIITIARQYGSCGREVGQKVAEYLGYDFYDNQLITMAAQKSGIDQSLLTTVDEKPVNSLLYTLALGSETYDYENSQVTLPINDRLFVLQAEIIKEIAEKESGAVIVGRCADYVLSERDDLIKIFICSDFISRVKNTMEKHDYTERQAKDAVLKTDRRRSNYYSYYTGEKWGKIENYDIVISTEKTGIEGTALIISDYIKRRSELSSEE